MNGVWITWETQRRNEELAAAFSVKYARFDNSSFSSIRRYFLSLKQTYSLLRTDTPDYVFAQCPSLVLCLFLGLYRFFRPMHLIIDAHNICIEQLQDSSPFLARFTRFVLGRAELLIVSNNSLVELLAEYELEAVALPDKLPHIECADIPSRFANHSEPRIVLIASFASDEPLERFISAFIDSRQEGTLFVTGRRSKAGSLLNLESERVVFTDFLEEPDYEALISKADLLVDLTTREDCLVCGAYEAIACGVPIILSDTQANREVFHKGTLYAENTADSYQQAIYEFFANSAQYRAEMQVMQSKFIPFWNACFEAAEKSITSL